MSAVCGENLVCIVLNFFSCTLENYLFSFCLLHHYCVDLVSLGVCLVNNLLSLGVCFCKVLFRNFLLLCSKCVSVLDSLVRLFLGFFSYLLGVFLSLVYYCDTLLLGYKKSISQRIFILAVLSYLLCQNFKLLLKLFVLILHLLVFDRNIL